MCRRGRLQSDAQQAHRRSGISAARKRIRKAEDDPAHTLRQKHTTERGGTYIERSGRRLYIKLFRSHGQPKKEGGGGGGEENKEGC